MTNTTSSQTQVNLDTIQTYLREHDLDGWLLYDFRGVNPIALHVAGLHSSGTRRWFLWIPPTGRPTWLIHAIEGNNFVDVSPQVDGEKRRYVSWQELSGALAQLVGAQPGQPLRFAMEYSPDCAIPYVSKVDAGTLELVRAATGAEIVSSADLVQLVQAVLTPAQLASHRRAAAHCMGAKESAIDFIRAALTADRPITEYDVQQHLMDYYVRVGLDTTYSPAVAINASAADPHYHPSAARHNPIRRGDMLLLDIFERESGDPLNCLADITWTFFCGPQTPPKVTQVFNVVAAARDAAVGFIQQRLDAGQPVHGYEVDEHSRGVIKEAGYGQYIMHRTGHSLGTAVHHNGVNIDNLETQDRRSLIPGVLFTIEPGIYLPQFNFDDGPAAKGLGIRSEINCTMHADRVEVTTLPLQTAVEAILG
ncbi:MAG: M24 family metallopeptidase [Caldilineaceae bacterium]